MMIPALWHESWTAALVNHLWQSTMVAALAWLLTLALRKNQARVRYWVWMTASVKFLLPFSLLFAAGEWVRSSLATPEVAQPAAAAMMQQIEQPFTRMETLETVVAPAFAGHRAEWLPLLLLACWACGALIIVAGWVRGWRRIRAALRTARPIDLVADIPVLASPALLEPGVFGLFRPVLLLPEGIQKRLTTAQLDSIVAHEMSHAHRRDNLTFALHMIVEAMFWFYPPVWWIDARLIEERERACDEAVVQAGGEAEVYAEGILSVCRFCVESPLGCASGVTGSDLKKRIVRIMGGGAARKLDPMRKLLLSCAGLLILVLPVALGLVRATQTHAQEIAAADLPKLEVVSVKPFKAGGMMIGIRMMPDGITMTGMPLYMLIRQTFGLPNDRILNEPAWVKSARYDLAAKVAAADAPKMDELSERERWDMMVPVLEDRFGIKFHHEIKVVRVYALVVANNKPKLQPAQSNQSQMKMGRQMMSISTQGMTLHADGVPMSAIARMISGQLGSTVVDKTGLRGRYDFTLRFMPVNGMAGMAGPMGLGGGQPGSGEAAPQPPPSAGDDKASPDATPPSLFTALQEQLGLKLKTQKEPMDVIVIDHIQQPSPN